MGLIQKPKTTWVGARKVPVAREAVQAVVSTHSEALGFRLPLAVQLKIGIIFVSGFGFWIDQL